MSPSQVSALDAMLSVIDKKYGPGTIMKFTDKVAFDPESILSSGSLTLDLALGVGGYKKGRIVEIFGPESAGKSTLCLHAIANAQRQNKVCAYIDTEHSLDPLYARNLGVKVDELLVSQPDYGEQALEIVDILTKSGEVSLIIVDSVAALIPQKELEGEMGDQHIGLQARMMSQAMRKLTGAVNQTNTIIIFTNQIRMKVGVIYGSPEVTSGGGALKFYASQRLDIRRKEAIKDGDKIIGNRTVVKIVKNKLAPPFREAEFDIKYGYGIDSVGEILDLAVEDELITKGGAWYTYKDQRFQGRSNILTYLNENKNILEELRIQLMSLRGL